MSPVVQKLVFKHNLYNIPSKLILSSEKIVIEKNDWQYTSKTITQIGQRKSHVIVFPSTQQDAKVLDT